MISRARGLTPRDRVAKGSSIFSVIMPISIADRIADERVIALKSERLTLQPGESITVSGMFSIPGSGEYVVQWEALTPPPGAPLASRTRVEVEASEGVGIITVTATIILVVASVAIVISYRYRARVWKRFQSNSIRQPG